MASGPHESTVTLPNSKDQKPSTSSVPTVVVISNAEPQSVIAGLRENTNVAPPAPEESDIIHTTELKKEHWATILRASGVLKAWKGQLEGGKLHVNRAACAAIALKPNDIGDDDTLDGIPEFEVSDDTCFETRESKTSLEREMTLKAFTESGIHAALSGGAQGVALGFGSDFSWAKGQELSSTAQDSASAIHSFYNRPQVIVHLDPDSFKLSPQCEKFFTKYAASCHMVNEREDVLKRFFDRFGAILACRVTLGGRLCTSQEVHSTDREHVSKMKKNLESQLTAKVEGVGVGVDAGTKHRKENEQNERYAQHGESSRLTLETQGGNGLLASSIPDWSASVASYRYWRAIQQDKPQDLLPVLVQLSEDTQFHDSVKALSQHAKTVQQEMHRNRPNYLDIAASAHYEILKLPGKEVTANAPSGSATSAATFTAPDSSRPRFFITVRLSKPSLVHTLHLSGRIVFYNSPGDTILNPHYLSTPSIEIPAGLIARDEMREEITFIFDGVKARNSSGESIKLNQAANVELRIMLEPFMKWGEGVKEQFPTDWALDSQWVTLKWADIEVNPEKRWELPVVHEESTPPPKQLVISDSATATLPEGRHSEDFPSNQGLTQEKKFRDRFRK